MWAAWYGAERLGLDFTRGVDERAIAGLATGTQLLAVGVLAFGVASLARIAIRRRGWAELAGNPPSREGS